MSKTAERTRDDQRLMNLNLRGVPTEVLDGIEKLGASMRPPVRRNDLIIHLLREAAEGRVIIGTGAPA